MFASFYPLSEFIKLAAVRLKYMEYLIQVVWYTPARNLIEWNKLLHIS